MGAESTVSAEPESYRTPRRCLRGNEGVASLVANLGKNDFKELVWLCQRCKAESLPTRSPI